jgi:8-oxo-dGTP diphosphatase
VTEDPEEADFATIGAWARPGPDRGAGVLLRDARGRVLMQLRDAFPEVARGGWWTLFGGGVEPGETLREAALREFAEETGVALDPAAPRPLARMLSSGPSRRRLYFFEARLDLAPAAIRVGEGAGFAFMTAAQLAEHRVIPEIRAVALALLARA